MKLETFLKKAFDWYYEEDIAHTNIDNEQAVELFKDTDIFNCFEQQVNGADTSQDKALNLADVSDSWLSKEEDEYYKKNNISNVSGVGIMKP